MTPPPPPRVYETILYAEDLAAAGAFYRDVLGLALIDDLTPTGKAFRLPSGALLLVFDPRESERPGRPAPPHGARGPGHVAFGVDPGQLRAWRAHLRERGVALEPSPLAAESGRQLYFRDPAGNSIELVEGDIWPAAG
jgi:catechol 2,3-dioxygenase-like lactoylglutathione lyase family enzyme